MNPNQLMQLATGYWPSCVLNTAVKLGVFQALESPQPVTELSVTLKVDAIYLERLLRGLVGLELLEEEGELFAISPEVSSFLGPNAPASLEGAIRYNADVYDLWGKLGQCIQSGEPVQSLDHHLGGDAEATRRFVMGMESRGKMMAPLIVNALPAPGGPAILDMGCGSGIISRLYTQKHPALKVTLFDLEPVLDVAEELWGDRGGDVTFHSGSYREDPLPVGPFDFVLYSGALHQESSEGAERLFRKVYEVLAPGGTLCIIDFLLEPDLATPVFSSLFSLNMMLIQPHGHVFACHEVEALLEEVGFREIESMAEGAGPYGKVTAIK